MAYFVVSNICGNEIYMCASQNLILTKKVEPGFIHTPFRDDLFTDFALYFSNVLFCAKKTSMFEIYSRFFFDLYISFFYGWLTIGRTYNHTPCTYSTKKKTAFI